MMMMTLMMQLVTVVHLVLSGYHDQHPVIVWFWEAIEKFDNERQLRLLQVKQLIGQGVIAFIFPHCPHTSTDLPTCTILAYFMHQNY